jgi:hypothetical protein
MQNTNLCSFLLQTKQSDSKFYILRLTSFVCIVSLACHTYRTDDILQNLTQLIGNQSQPVHERSVSLGLQTSLGPSSKCPCPHTLEPIVPRFRILGENRHFLNNGKKQLNKNNYNPTFKIRMNFKIPTVLWLPYYFLSLKNDVSVASRRNEQKM